MKAKKTKNKGGRPPLGAAKKVQHTMHLPPELLAWAAEQAAQDDRTVSYFLTKLLEAERDRVTKRKG